MNNERLRNHQSRRAFVLLAGFFALGAIILLGVNVAHEIRLLQSSQSDNVQWSLSQSEVEFLKYRDQITSESTDIVQLRRRFDVFYSRISTIQSATVFENQRADEVFSKHLGAVRSFLDRSADIVDLPASELRQMMPRLAEMAAIVRKDVRNLSNSGLRSFAKAADLQRVAVSQTLLQLTAALALLIGALAFGIVYLNWVNARGRSRQVELSSTMQRMNTITSTALDGVIVSDTAGRILEFNAAAESIFGHFSGDVIGRDLGSVIIPDHLRKLHDAGMDRMRQRGTKRVVGKGRVALEAKHADGHVFPVELAIQSAETDDGEIFIAFLRDISTQVAAEADLVDARDKALASEKMKTEFLATMSHEIRTPLNGLLGNMTLLRDTNLGAQQERYLKNMETSGRLLMSHVSDVLDITRYDAGKLTVHAVPTHISNLLQDIVDNQGGAAAANETALEWGWIGAPYHWILSDPDRLQHILINLIGNAVKFTVNGKVIVTFEAVSEGTAGLSLRVEVCDTGPGIDAAISPHIFDDFVTGNTAYDRKVGGTGLGLSIANRFVIALGGEIGVESVIGESSKFWVTLPLVPAEDPKVTKPNQPVEGLSKLLSVLVVEDNEINQIVVRDMLESDGHMVMVAVNGREGVNAASLKPYDIIFMDISMPVMDGRTATRKIREGSGPNSTTPIFALTANAMASEQKLFLKDGMNAVLSKPLSRGILRDVLSGIASTSPIDTAQILDLAHCEETRDAVGLEPFGTLISRFSTEVTAFISWLQSSNANDPEQIASRAHNLAGSAAILGAVALRDALNVIEGNAKSGDVERVLAQRKSIDEVWARTKSAIENLL